MLDSKLVSVFTKYPDVIDTIHFSDQFTGPKPADVSIIHYSYSIFIGHYLKDVLYHNVWSSLL
jgi:hypothetical protein